MYKISLLLITMLVYTVDISAQPQLTLKQVIDTALYNNLGIMIRANEAQMAENNNSLGNAGILPRVDVNGGISTADNTIRQRTSDGNTVDTDNARTDNLNGNAELNWRIFNGGRMFATHQKLKHLEALGELRVKQEVVAVIASASRAYFELIRQQQLVKFLQGTFNFYQERKNLAETKLQLGSSPRTELLQAQVDFNAQQSILARQEALLAAARVEVNRMMLKNPADSILATDTLVQDTLFNFDELMSRIDNGNLDLREQMILQQIASSELKENRADYFPVIDADAGYRYNRNNTTQGFFLENESFGPGAGLTLSWNLFNGSVQRNRVKNAKLVIENARLTYEQVRINARAALTSAWIRYQAEMKVVRIEEASQQLASDNLSIVMERFRLNESNVIELREAQRTAEEAQGRLADASYVVRVTGVELQQLAGLLTPLD